MFLKHNFIVFLCSHLILSWNPMEPKQGAMFSGLESTVAPSKVPQLKLNIKLLMSYLKINKPNWKQNLCSRTGDFGCIIPTNLGILIFTVIIAAREKYDMITLYVITKDRELLREKLQVFTTTATSVVAIPDWK